MSENHPELRHGVIAAAKLYYEASQREEPFVAGKTYIPATAKKLSFDDLAMLLEASMDLWLTTGRFGRDFEAKLPHWFGKKSKALLVNSGSSANLIAVSSLCSPLLTEHDLMPLKKGDEVITVAAGFPTTVNPIFQNGLVPVFVDVDLATLNAKSEKIFEAKTSRTRAVVLAHTLGNPFRSDQVAEWCRKEGLFLVEDCCDAIGAEISGQPAGSFGDYATVSFYPAHHMTMGEGGAVMSKDGKMRRVSESLRDWGRDCWCEPGKDNTCGKRFQWQLGDLPEGYDHKYIYSQIGYNLKVTDMQAAIGLSQMEKLPLFIKQRRQNWKKLYDGIRLSPVLKENLTPVVATDKTEPSWFGFAVNVREGINRHKLTQFLEQGKVGTRLLFGGDLTCQPAYKGLEFRTHGVLTNTKKIMRHTFWIGVHPALDDSRLHYMLEQLEAGIRAQK